MITAIDSNVIIGLWNADDTLNPLARKALEGAFAGVSLVICGAVFGELIACPGRTEQLSIDFWRILRSQSIGQAMKLFGEPPERLFRNMPTRDENWDRDIRAVF